MLDITLMGLPGGAARIVRWLRSSGDYVEAGEPLLIVLNDRVEVALPAPQSGTLAEVLVVEGGATAAGVLLARLDQTKQPSPEPDEAVAQPDDQEAGPAPQPAATLDRPQPIRLRATPLARRIAAARQIDLTMVPGRGPDGRIRKADVLAWDASQKPPTDDMLHLTPPAPRDMSSVAYHAAQVIPAAVTVMQVDMSAVAGYIEVQRAVFAQRQLNLTAMACVAYAVATVLQQHPLINAYWSDDGIVQRRRTHLGVVFAEQTAPQNGRPSQRLAVVHDAGDLTLRGVARALQSAVEPGSGQNGQASPPEAVPLTLIGHNGATWWSGMLPIQAGQSAWLSVGATSAQPVVFDQRIVVRPTMLLTLSYDARLLDQSQADAFLCDVRKQLEHFI